MLIDELSGLERKFLRGPIKTLHWMSYLSQCLCIGLRIHFQHRSIHIVRYGQLNSYHFAECAYLSQLFTPGVVGAHENPAWYIKKPLGYSYFPMELSPTPRSWVATTGDLVFYRQHHSVSTV